MTSSLLGGSWSLGFPLASVNALKEVSCDSSPGMVLWISTSLHCPVDNGYSPETTLGFLWYNPGGKDGYPPTSYPAVGKPAFITCSPFPQQIGKPGGGKGRADSSSPIRLLWHQLTGGIGPCCSLCWHKRNGAMFRLGHPGWTFLCCLSPWPLSALSLNSSMYQHSLPFLGHNIFVVSLLCIVFFSFSVTYSFQFLKSFLCLLNI